MTVYFRSYQKVEKNSATTSRVSKFHPLSVSVEEFKAGTVHPKEGGRGGSCPLAVKTLRLTMK